MLPPCFVLMKKAREAAYWPLGKERILEITL